MTFFTKPLKQYAIATKLFVVIKKLLHQLVVTRFIATRFFCCINLLPRSLLQRLATTFCCCNNTLLQRLCSYCNDIFRCNRPFPSPPKPDYTLTEPPSYKIAAQHPQWCSVMGAEFDALHRFSLKQMEKVREKAFILQLEKGKRKSKKERKKKKRKEKEKE